MASLAPASAVKPSSKLPHYEHPPLVEVVLGVRWSFHGTLDSRAQQDLLDRLGPAWQLPAASEPTHAAIAESWHRPAAVFQSVLGEQRLEIGSDGLDYAWDGRQGDLYPHYESVRDGFVVTLDAWNDWMSSLDAPPSMICGWKVSYLNRLPQGTVWNSLSDCGFFRLLAPLPTGLPQLQRCEGHWQFGLEREDAALSCDLKTTSGTARDPRDCLWLRLTCSGGLDGQDSAVLEGLDYGRKTIVNAFRQLMSPAANAYWELSRDS